MFSVGRKSERDKGLAWLVSSVFLAMMKFGGVLAINVTSLRAQ